MSIRLRIVDGTHVALCAAKTEAEEGDIHLDDAWHEAIAAKFWRDYEEIETVDEERFAIMEALEEDTELLPWPEPTTPARITFHQMWMRRYGCS
jgi:hypothetical protein